MKEFKALQNKMSELADIANIMSLAHWDQEVYMPEKAAIRRGQQMATLSGMHHEKFTDSETGKLLNDLMSDKSLNAMEQSDVFWLKKEYDRSIKFTKEFVTNKSMVVSQSFMQWDKAKRASDFSIFQDSLEKVVAIVREEAAILGYEDHPYDALIDLYEPGMTVKKLDKLFSDVNTELKPLLDKIKNKEEGDETFLLQFFPKEDQLQLSETILEKFGFDFKAGRQDISSHPFCTSFSTDDVRVTTRVDENDLANSIWSTVHECGHALYEQGLPRDRYGLPSGSTISLGIHESQSRFWENCIARSEGFVEGYSNLFRTQFPNQFKEISNAKFYQGINVVKPSYIRTEADELTYHFHIMIRYEIEKELVMGTLKVKDVREVWNQKYKEYLGIEIVDDAKGVMQDVHWSHGGIGYFPTYSLGSFYAAQWWHFIQKENPTVINDLKQMDTTKILQWLRTNIHQQGRLYTAEDLCSKLTGEPLNFNYFMKYSNEKYSKIYSL